MGWGHTEDLLASLIEVLDRHDRHFQSAHLKKGQRPTKAIVVPRPRDLAKRKRRRNASGQELAAMVNRMGGAKVVSPNGD